MELFLLHTCWEPSGRCLSGTRLTPPPPPITEYTQLPSFTYSLSSTCHTITHTYTHTITSLNTITPSPITHWSEVTAVHLSSQERGKVPSVRQSGTHTYNLSATCRQQPPIHCMETSTDSLDRQRILVRQVSKVAPLVLPSPNMCN